MVHIILEALISTGFRWPRPLNLIKDEKTVVFSFLTYFDGHNYNSTNFTTGTIDQKLLLNSPLSDWTAMLILKKLSNSGTASKKKIRKKILWNRNSKRSLLSVLHLVKGLEFYMVDKTPAVGVTLHNVCCPKGGLMSLIIRYGKQIMLKFWLDKQLEKPTCKHSRQT